MVAQQVPEPGEEHLDVGVVLVRSHGARNAAKRDRAPQIPGQGTTWSQQFLGVQALVGGLVVWRRKDVAQVALQFAIVVAAAQRPPDCARYQQVALDVAAAPGQDLEAFQPLRLRFIEHVPVEDAEAANTGVLGPRALEMSSGTVGLATSENHRGAAHHALEAR